MMTVVGPQQPTDVHWMRHAMQLAERAWEIGEVPVGAVVVRGDELIGEGWNHPISGHDPTAHAEMAAMREAARRLGNYRLQDCSLIVTLEPCVMCAGAILHARFRRLVFGAWDRRAGAVCSCYDLIGRPRLNHSPDWTGGVLEAETAALLHRFFRTRRQA